MHGLHRSLRARNTPVVNESELPQQDREFLELHEAAILAAYPNPLRIGCQEEPGRTTFLRTLAFKRREVSIRDPRLDHLTQCSLCFKEFVQFRNQARQII